MSTQKIQNKTFSSQPPPEWIEQLDNVMQIDRDFFLQHPDLNYYVRPITSVEILEGQAREEKVTETTFVLVGEVVPGVRMRLNFNKLSPPLEEFKACLRKIRKETKGKPSTLRERMTYYQKHRTKAKGFRGCLRSFSG